MASACCCLKILNVVLILILLNFSTAEISETTGASNVVSEQEEATAVKQLLLRLIPHKAHLFQINVDYGFDDKDAFEIVSTGRKLKITGNRGYTAAAGVYHYLKYFCNCHVSWSGNQLNLPKSLPVIDSPLRIIFNDKYRYYQNVCTSSYSYVWWTWERWEKEIDWMALNGINLALAFTAQESIYNRVFKKMNMTNHDIEVFFTGPAFLAWNRMGNMQAWVGPLTDNWHRKQINLQHRILKRMRSFGMTPVLPAFSGRVPPAFKRVFPNANTTFMAKYWGHFRPPFSNVTFLQPTDSLFGQVGAEFLKTYIEEFGTNHVYNADLFNEMPPPSNDTNYLKACAKAMYKTLTDVDPEAIWMIQGWMFYSDSDIWQEAQSQAFLRAIPLGKMIVLDLQSELYPQYERLNSYFGQPFIWCMLHNYGGVVGLYGSLENVNKGVFIGRNLNGSTMVGIGLTPEGIETNDIVYEFMNEMAWRSEPVNIDQWLEKFSLRRYGNHSSDLVSALKLLKKSVYNATVPYRNHGKYILIRRPSLKLKPYIWYDPKDVLDAWNLFLNASSIPHLNQSKLYQHDLVDLTRQCLQLAMDIRYSSMVKSFRKKNIYNFVGNALQILTLFDDMETILASDEHFLLGRWLKSAIDLAETPLERLQYEYNARNQITLWGPSGEILDYANKQWAGLMSNYYRKRWKFFLENLLNSLINNKPFKQSDFNSLVYKQIEYEFDLGRESYSSEPLGDPVDISMKLFKKYGNLYE